VTATRSGGVAVLAETVNGLRKTEVIRRRGQWRKVDLVELAVPGAEPFG
jgi:hypothetical protein